MKILFLTDNFYPRFGANSLIVNTVAQEMVKRGIQVFVMPAVYDPSLPEREKYQGIDIIRRIVSDNKENAVHALRKGKLITAANVIIKHFQIKASKTKHLWHKDRILSRGYLKQFIEDNSIDAVISTNCSIELSFPILWLIKKRKASCKWFFYMLDPFESHMYYRQHYPVTELRKWQHKIMEECDGVFATDIICKEIREWETNSIIEKLHVLEFPKIEEPTVNPCEDDIELPNDKINVLCTGSKNEEVRNSEFALKVCRSMNSDNVLFHFVGIGWTETDGITDGNCIFYTPRSWQAIRNIQIKADYLLNIGNIISNQLPSKVLEYISTGVPVINFYKRTDCPTLKLLCGYDSLNIYENDVEQAVKDISAFIEKKHLRSSFEKIKEEYKAYTPEYVAESMIQKIHTDT